MLPSIVQASVHPLIRSAFGGVLMLALCFGGGCGPRPPQVRETPAESQDRWLATAHLSIDEALRVADQVASEDLDRVNASWSAEEHEELGGPFELKDYERKTPQRWYENRPLLWVDYEYTKPVSFWGHPEHFTVWVYCDNGATDFFAGR